MRPLRTQPSPSRRAVVVMLCELVPASGSVIANAIVCVPSAMPGSQRCFCSSVPNRLITVPQMAGLTTIISSGQPCAASSSQHRRHVADAAATAAVLLGDVDAEVAVLADLQPQVGGLAAAARLLHEVVPPVAAGELGDRRAQRRALLGLGERCLVMRLLLVTSAALGGRRPPALPGCHLRPDRDRQVGDRPACGAVIVCCIFMASRTSTGSPAATAVPGSTARRDDASRASARAASRSRPGRPGR